METTAKMVGSSTTGRNCIRWPFTNRISAEQKKRCENTGRALKRHRCARPLRISSFYNFSAIVMRRQHADIAVQFSSRSHLVLFVSWRTRESRFGLHASFAWGQRVVCQKKSIYISHSDWQMTCDSIKPQVSVLRHGGNASYRFSAALFTYLCFVILYWMCQKRLSPGCTTNTRYRHSSYVSHFYSPRFNWIKYPNRGNGHVHQAQTWTLCCERASVQPQTRRNWLSSFHAIRQVLEIVKRTLIFGLFLIWFD